MLLLLLPTSSNRFKAETALLQRPDTHIAGLFLAGQDVFTAGFVPSMLGGLFAASAVLKRQLYLDLLLARFKRGGYKRPSTA